MQSSEIGEDEKFYQNVRYGELAYKAALFCELNEIKIIWISSAHTYPSVHSDVVRWR